MRWPSIYIYKKAGAAFGRGKEGRGKGSRTLHKQPWQFGRIRIVPGTTFLHVKNIVFRYGFLGMRVLLPQMRVSQNRLDYEVFGKQM